MRKIKIFEWFQWRALGFPVMVLAVVVGLGFLFLKPKIGEILNWRYMLPAEKKRLSVLSQKVAGLEGLSAPAIDERLKKTFLALPSEKKAPEVLATISAICGRIGASIEGFDSQMGDMSGTVAGATDKGKAITAVAGLDFFDLRLSFFSKEDSILNFVKMVEKSSPLLQILSLNISRRSDVYRTEAVVRSYYGPLPEKLVSGDNTFLLSVQEEAAYQRMLSLESVLEAAGQESFELIPAGKPDPFKF